MNCYRVKAKRDTYQDAQGARRLAVFGRSGATYDSDSDVMWVLASNTLMVADEFPDAESIELVGRGVHLGGVNAAPMGEK